MQALRETLLSQHIALIEQLELTYAKGIQALLHQKSLIMCHSKDISSPTPSSIRIAIERIIKMHRRWEALQFIMNMMDTANHDDPTFLNVSGVAAKDAAITTMPPFPNLAANTTPFLKSAELPAFPLLPVIPNLPAISMQSVPALVMPVAAAAPNSNLNLNPFELQVVNRNQNKQALRTGCTPISHSIHTHISHSIHVSNSQPISHRFTNNSRSIQTNSYI